MVKSKPKISTLFSIGVFLAIAYGVFGYSLVTYINTDSPSIVTMILIVATGPIALVVTLKTLLGIKHMEIAKEKFRIRYPFRFKQFSFTGKELEYWKVDKVKTYGGVYEELIWKTKSGQKMSISKQEHTDYDKALKYMSSKFKKLRQS